LRFGLLAIVVLGLTGVAAISLAYAEQPLYAPKNEPTSETRLAPCLVLTPIEVTFGGDLIGQGVTWTTAVIEPQSFEGIGPMVDTLWVGWDWPTRAQDETSEIKRLVPLVSEALPAGIVQVYVPTERSCSASEVMEVEQQDGKHATAP
jgi:hypothetical protein